MTRKRAKRPFFRIEDYKKNPVQAVFDLIEWKFYDTAPKFTGVPGRAFIQDRVVYIDYDIAEVQTKAYKRFVVESDQWKDLIAQSYTLQNAIYSMIFLKGVKDKPREIFNIVFNYYFPQQYIRIFVAPRVISYLINIGIDIEDIGFDKTPVMDSPEPRDKAITAMGYRKALREMYLPINTSEKTLRKLANLGLDYTAHVIDYVRIVSWAQYFAQTEDAFTFGLIREYVVKYGIGKDLDFYKEVISGVELQTI